MRRDRGRLDTKQTGFCADLGWAPFLLLRIASGCLALERSHCVFFLAA